MGYGSGTASRRCSLGPRHLLLQEVLFNDSCQCTLVAALYVGGAAYHRVATPRRHGFGESHRRRVIIYLIETSLLFIFKKTIIYFPQAQPPPPYREMDEAILLSRPVRGTGFHEYGYGHGNMGTGSAAARRRKLKCDSVEASV